MQTVRKLFHRRRHDSDRIAHYVISAGTLAHRTSCQRHTCDPMHTLSNSSLNTPVTILRFHHRHWHLEQIDALDCNLFEPSGNVRENDQIPEHSTGRHQSFMHFNGISCADSLRADPAYLGASDKEADTRLVRHLTVDEMQPSWMRLNQLIEPVSGIVPCFTSALRQELRVSD